MQVISGNARWFPFKDMLRCFYNHPRNCKWDRVSNGKCPIILCLITPFLHLSRMLRFMIRLHSILNCVRHVFSFITNVDEIYDVSFQNKEERPISMILHVLCILVQFAIMMNKYQLHFVIYYINHLSRNLHYGHQSFIIFRDDPSKITHMMYIATWIRILASLWPRTRATFRRVSRSCKLLISQNSRFTVAFKELHFG